MPRGDALRARPPIGGAAIVAEPVLHGGEKRRQRQRGIGRDRQVHRDQRLKRVRPAPHRVVLERDGDHARALVQEAHLARAPVGHAEGAQQARHVEGEDDVGVAQYLVTGAAHVERMAAGTLGRPAYSAARSISGAAEQLGQPAERRRHAGPAAEELHDDHRVPRLDQPPGGVVDGARIGVRGRRRLEARRIRHRDRAGERLLLERRVQAEVHRALRLGAREPPHAEE